MFSSIYGISCQNGLFGSVRTRESLLQKCHARNGHQISMIDLQLFLLLKDVFCQNVNNTKYSSKC